MIGEQRKGERQWGREVREYIREGKEKADRIRWGRKR